MLWFWKPERGSTLFFSQSSAPPGAAAACSHLTKFLELFEVDGFPLRVELSELAGTSQPPQDPPASAVLIVALTCGYSLLRS